MLFLFILALSHIGHNLLILIESNYWDLQSFKYGYLSEQVTYLQVSVSSY